MSRYDSDLDAAEWLNPDDELDARESEEEPSYEVEYCDRCGCPILSGGCSCDEA